MAATAAAVSLALTSTAAAQETKLSGQTSDGAAVKLTVGEFGNATAFRVGEDQVECNRGGELTNRAFTYEDFDRSDPGAFRDRRRGSDEPGGFRFKTGSRITGNATPDFLSWSGVYKVTTKVFKIKTGEKVDTCKVNATWDAG